MIDRVGTIWGENAQGRPVPVTVYRVGGRFRLSGAGSSCLVEDRIETAVSAAAERFGISDPHFAPSRLPVRDAPNERRGSHPSYGWDRIAH